MGFASEFFNASQFGGVERYRNELQRALASTRSFGTNNTRLFRPWHGRKAYSTRLSRQSLKFRATFKISVYGREKRTSDTVWSLSAETLDFTGEKNGHSNSPLLEFLKGDLNPEKQHPRAFKNLS